MVTTASLIRSIRASKGFSQEYIANELGIKQAAYSNIESGKSDITLNRLHDIANLLEVSIFDLIIDNTNKSEKEFNEPLPKYSKSNGYEISVTIKLNDPAKEREVLNLIGINK
ncbi:helix-turn-helix domain-containing protein [Nubsella zeaxanthinifaciens]|uniref:helix-turn-helix domain-containing protein n=1 Tax=Nubsella zeaxanthinifaciens TaxID=392412 RepID=UPI000DE31E54|nr:helix-turn-helix transcriptional regulator [Nubsella zeaxanthinifaciens]